MLCSDISENVLGFKGTCGHKVPLLEFLGDEQKLWLPRVSLRKQVSCFWYFSRGDSVEKTLAAVDLAWDSTQKLYTDFVDLVAQHQESANERLDWKWKLMRSHFDVRPRRTQMESLNSGGYVTSAAQRQTTW